MSRKDVAMRRELRAIRSAFKQLARSFKKLEPVLALNSRNGAGPKPARKQRKITRAQRAAMRLQGQYMGTMRGLKPRQQARVKRNRADKGIRAAIAEARRMRIEAQASFKTCSSDGPKTAS